MYLIAYILFHRCDFRNMNYGKSSQFFLIWLILVKQCRRIEVCKLHFFCDLLPKHTIQNYFGGNKDTSVDGVCESSMMNAVQLAIESLISNLCCCNWLMFCWRDNWWVCSMMGFCSVIWFHHGQQRVGFMFSQGSSQPWHSMLVSPTHLARLSSNSSSEILHISALGVSFIIT